MTNSSKATKCSIQINYNGMFVTSPFAYEGGEVKSLGNLDFTNMEYHEFSDFLKKETDTECSGIYFVTPGKELHNGLKLIKSDMDFKAFVHCGVKNKGKLSLYLEHFDEDLTEYLEDVIKDKMDESENETDNSMTSDDIEDDDTASIDHLSEDEVELSELRKTKKSPTSERNRECNSGQNSLFDTDADEEQLPKGDTMETEHETFLNDLLISLQKDTQIVKKDDVSKEGDIRFPKHNPRIYWKLMKPVLGERYESPQQLKACITNYAVANGYQIWFERNDHMRLLARCCKRSNDDETKCPWRLWATWMSNEKSFQVKSLVDEHKCARNFKSASLVNYKWIAKKFATKIRQDPRMKPVKLQAAVLKKYKCQVSMSLCIRAKAFAVSEYEQGARQHYGKLWEYAEEIKRSNPGSTVKMNVEVNPDGLTFFQGFYVCFHGLKEGWMHGCRKVLGLGECFLKTVYKGVLLSAVGKDGNNQIFPVAWGVVNVENKENWSWFLNLVRKDLILDDGTGVTLISNQTTGVTEAVNDLMPQAEHRQCARHIYEDFTEKFPTTQFKRLFWAASKASYPQEFDRVMEEIRVANPDAYQYLMDKDPSTWSRVFFQTNVGCDAVENGISECFNSLILDLRRKPIVTLLESIRIIVMDRMSKMREKSEKWDDDICPATRKKLEHTKELERFWRVIPCGGSLFEVKHGVDVFMVDEIGKTCSCRMWQLSGLPCPHAVAAIFYINKLPEAYVPEWFKMNMFNKTYNYELNPLNEIKMWPKTKEDVPLAPKAVIINTPKKRKLKRKREVMVEEGYNGAIVTHVSSGGTINREGRRMTCKKCLQVGHNVRSCKNEKRDSPRKEARQPGRKKTMLALGESSGGRGRKKGLFGSGRDDVVRGGESVPLAVCPPVEVQLLLEGKDESEMELTSESQDGFEKVGKGEESRDVDMNGGEDHVSHEDEEPISNKDQESSPIKDEGPIPIEVDEHIPHEDQEPITSEDKDTIPIEDKKPIPNEDQDPIPMEDEECILNKDQESIPNEVQRPILDEEKEPIPNEDKEESITNNDQNLVPHEIQETTQNEGQESIPHENQEPTLKKCQEPIPNEGQEPISNEDQEVNSNEGQDLIPREGEEPIANEGQEPISHEDKETIQPRQQMRPELSMSEGLVKEKSREDDVEKDGEGSGVEKAVMLDN
ncbi:hypothetical protein L1887_04054 [Cichorium endivia]|nr:hypothetical protein L1887_04054 [Cichorium endivia]